jgi:hypothetical protein
VIFIGGILKVILFMAKPKPKIILSSGGHEGVGKVHSCGLIVMITI